MTGAALIVLASSSPYRRELLARLGLPFRVAAPRTDETALAGESALNQVRRLAEAKARAVAAQFPRALLIGSDQLALLDGKVLGKPGDHTRAAAQLRALRGKRAEFHTGLCLYDAGADSAQIDCVTVAVQFRNFSDDEIERYLERERPYHCAGSFMSERLGISLVAHIDATDPTALIGLPLIRLAAMLRTAGVQVP